MTPNVAVIYYSATGSVHRVAEAIAEGAVEAGAEVRLRRVRELAPEEAIASNPVWQAHRDRVQDAVEEASLDDLVWADGIALGSPTRFGNPASQLRQFIDTAGGLWMSGALVDKVGTSFTAAGTLHGGMEATILALNNTFYHLGMIIVAPGYTDPVIHAAGGNPYGSAFHGGPNGVHEMSPELTAAARYQGGRLAKVAALMASARQPA